MTAKPIKIPVEDGLRLMNFIASFGAYSGLGRSHFESPEETRKQIELFDYARICHKIFENIETAPGISDVRNMLYTEGAVLATKYQHLLDDSVIEEIKANNKKLMEQVKENLKEAKFTDEEAEESAAKIVPFPEGGRDGKV